MYFVGFDYFQRLVEWQFEYFNIFIFDIVIGVSVLIVIVFGDKKVDQFSYIVW